MRTTITLAATVLVMVMGFHPADADNALLPLWAGSIASAVANALEARV